MPAPRQIHDLLRVAQLLRIRRIELVAQHRVRIADVDVAFVKRDPERLIEPGQKFFLLRRPAAIRGQTQNVDFPRVRVGEKNIFPVRPDRQPPRLLKIRRDHFDLESRRHRRQKSLRRLRFLRRIPRRLRRKRRRQLRLLVCRASPCPNKIPGAAHKIPNAAMRIPNRLPAASIKVSSEKFLKRSVKTHHTNQQSFTTNTAKIFATVLPPSGPISPLGCPTEPFGSHCSEISARIISDDHHPTREHFS